MCIRRKKNTIQPACVPLLLSIINDVMFHGIIIKAHNMKAMTKNLYFRRNARVSINFKPSVSLRVIILTKTLLLLPTLHCSEQDMLIRLIPYTDLSNTTDYLSSIITNLTYY